jgi:hypothetical protein
VSAGLGTGATQNSDDIVLLEGNAVLFEKIGVGAAQKAPGSQDIVNVDAAARRTGSTVFVGRISLADIFSTLAILPANVKSFG